MTIYIKRLVEKLNSNKMDYYLHAGYAMQLIFKTRGDSDDIDIRINTSVKDLYEKLAINQTPDFTSPIIRGEMEHRRYKFITPCLEFNDVDGTEYDIVGDMITDMYDVGTIVFPRSDEWFSECDQIEVDGIKINIANIYQLLSYYVFYRREENEGKHDLDNIDAILTSDDFNLDKLSDFAHRYFQRGNANFLVGFSEVRLQEITS